VTLPAPDTTASSGRSIVVPAPTPARSPWASSVVTALAAGVAVGAAGAARGQLDPVAAVITGAAVMAARALGSLMARREGRAARDRWLSALDETEAVCDAVLEARRRSLRHLWPTSADLVERLRRGEAPPVLGVPSLVVLGVGRVESGIVLVGERGAPVTRHARTETLRERIADVPYGPRCVDAAGGVHVRGPALLARSLAGGYRAQLRHRGAPEGLVTWQRTGPDGTGAVDTGPDGTGLDETGRDGAGADEGGGGAAATAACVVDISSHGGVTVVRREGSACSVPVAPSWTSLLDAAGAPRAPAAPRGQPVRPERP
jgi:hypothetical protein